MKRIGKCRLYFSFVSIKSKKKKKILISGSSIKEMWGAAEVHWGMEHKSLWNDFPDQFFQRNVNRYYCIIRWEWVSYTKLQ